MPPFLAAGAASPLGCSAAFLAAEAALKSNAKLGYVTALQKTTVPKTLAHGAILRTRLVYLARF